MRSHAILVGDSHLTATSSRGVTKLDPRLRDAGCEVENLAVAGLTTRDALAILPGVMPTGMSVFSFGTNDAAPWSQISLDEFSENYDQLLARCRGEIVVLGPPPVLESLASPRTNARLRRYSDAAAAVTAGAQGTFVDLIELFDVPDDVLADDGVHLNDVGYDGLAEIVLAALRVAG